MAQWIISIDVYSIYQTMSLDIGDCGLSHESNEKTNQGSNNNIN